MRILITGSNGLFGQKIVYQLLNAKEVFLATSLGVNRNDACPTDHYCAMDITNQVDIERVMKDFQPTHVIHTAAMTNVDACELDPPTCESINVDAVRYLAHACQKNGVHFQLLSTDFVFDGVATLPYLPAAPVSPLSVYGCSKQAGEQELLKNAGDRSCIVRTAWLYSELGKNFVNTMLALMASKDEIKVVDDQRGTPTSVASLAAVVWRLVERPDLRGVYHWTDGGETSWYGFACEIQRLGLQYGLLQRLIPMLPIATAQYPTAARRPSYSVLDITATCEALQISPAAWQLEEVFLTNKITIFSIYFNTY